MRALLLLLFLISSIFLQAQLIPNGGFEVDVVAPFGKPDFYRFRTNDYHEIEPDTVRSGSFAARFNNTSGSPKYGYYYSNYDAAGSTKNFIPVMTGETYELNFYYRTAVDFTGEGIGAQILFANDQGHIVGDVLLEPYRVSPNQWSSRNCSSFGHSDQCCLFRSLQ